MAAFILHLIFVTTFLQGLAAQRTNSSVSVGASLTATPDATPWLSPSGEFAFGFQQVQGNENFLLSIWYDKIPDKTIVWYPRNGPMQKKSPMAAFILHLIFVTTFLQGLAAQRTNSSVSVGASLTATPDATPWLSPSGEFAFGFQQVQGNENFLLSIWYDKIPDKTIVWYPRNGPMVSQGSKIELTNGLGLVLSDPRGRQVWSSGSISDLAYGAMNDTGNFMLVGSDSRKKWESFNFPADTLLPTQIMARNGVINSRMSETNFTGGRFQLRLLQDGNLVLNPVLFFDSADDTYYSSGTKDDSNSTNSGDKLILDATGYMYILKRNGKRSDLTVRDTIPSGDYYFRATLDSDGVFTQYYYPKNPNGNTSWEVIWSEPNDICGEANSRACGLNSVCSLNSNRRPTCKCPKGFSLVDSNDPYGDCKPDFSPSCDEVYTEDQFDFIELSNIDWLYSDYAFINGSNEEDCKTSCLKDCFCAIAIYRVNRCWKKKLPLSNGKVDSSGVKAFVKFLKGGLPPKNPPVLLQENKNQRSLIAAGSALLGTSVFVIIVLVCVICFGFFQIYKKKARNSHPSSKAVETNLPHFTYQELVKATDGFKDELGRGAIGIVYKGVIGTRTVAVKKLQTVDQNAQKEFKAEVNTIAKTHHKNLVQLLGYCDDGDQQLLVYEYMSNATLAVFLFGETRPSWKQRSDIGVGIAKGLAYLHEECSTQIIHCDIKPQNILLDEYYNAKISDFGLAKHLMMNQSRTNTGIRGTKGYVAPEWFRNTLITVKVDVYSFGVLLLEIISCRRSVHFDSNNEDVEVLTDWAWDCYQEGKMDAFVGNDLEDLDEFKKLTTFVMVALWCVQENPSLRPTMRKVVQMLEGVVEVTEPPCPPPFSSSSITRTTY
ncbi:Bulb-type lectin domain-containing protein [Artemisia annua]|uniref:Receptor-like serine/threonine-protein kinase n=1 Tax=Artemisia annua TaxID=35608 RepID=A0A2U1MKE1_ARTAN|nr:Bulb-type lectin domain-containing protein [Artemisia annua]